MKTKSVNALEVTNGMIVYNCGYRCIVSDVSHHEFEGDKLPVARYTLHSAPGNEPGRNLPVGYEGMRAGGNKLHAVAVEV